MYYCANTLAPMAYRRMTESPFLGLRLGAKWKVSEAVALYGEGDMNRLAGTGVAGWLIAGILAAPAWAASEAEAFLSAFDERLVGAAARFVAIPSGTFMMGVSVDAGGGKMADIGRPVTLTHSYDMQATDVTQLQYVLVMGGNPARFHGAQDCGEGRFLRLDGVELCADNPVESVSWEDVARFLARLNAMQEQYAYRLPTAAEWERAARAGGGSEGGAWAAENSGGRIHPVARLQADAWGLYDMLGDVMMWTGDRVDMNDPYAQGPAIDPSGAAKGDRHVVRGAFWMTSAAFSRAGTATYGYGPRDFRRPFLGFRLVRASRGPSSKRVR